MKHSYTILLLAATLSAAVLNAQYATNILDVNDAHVRFQSNGHMGASGTLTPYFYVPATPDNSGPSPFFAGSMWIGGLTPDNILKFAGERFEQVGLDYFPGPLGTNAGISPAVSAQYDQLWKVNRTDVQRQIAYFNCLNDPTCDEQAEFPGYTVPPSFYSWPAHGDISLGEAYNLADFYDYNGDGQYNPDQGDGPCVPGDQALFSIFNDNLSAHGESGGQPIGLEVHFTPFAFASSDPAVNQTVFIRYRLINRSSQTLQDTYVGFWNDYDLGGAVDDYVQCDVGRNLFYVFNGDSIDEDANGWPGYGAQPPAFGEVFLQGPRLDADSMDNTETNSLPGYNGTGFNDGIVDNEHIGISHFMYHNNANGAAGDPTIALEYYRYLKGDWLDATPLTYGGSGYSLDSTAIPAHYMFPGDSDPLGVGTNGTTMPPWTEGTSGNAPGDRRGVASMGPFTFAPGQVENIVVAYVYARANGGLEASSNALKLRVDSIRAFAQTIPGLLDGSGSACDQLPAVIASHAAGYNALRLFPNPATDQLNVVQPNGMREGVATIYDAQGRIALQQEFHANLVNFNTGELAPGIYMLRVQAGGKELGRSFVKAQ